MLVLQIQAVKKQYSNMAENDITKTGPLSWRELQNRNSEPVNLPDKGPGEWTPEERAEISRRTLSTPISSYRDQDLAPVGIEASKAHWGDSKFDDSVESLGELENLNDYRYSEQSWVDVLANGAMKLLGTGATTFLSSFGNLAVGVPTALTEGRFSGLWDNAFSEAMTSIDEAMEDNFKNYVSNYQQQDPSWRLGDMNWWSDNFIKNVGFTLGAAAAGSLFSGGLGLIGDAFSLIGKAQKVWKNSSALLSSLFSAAGEGAIEAKNLMNEMEESLNNQLSESLAPEYQAAEEEYKATGDFETYRKKMLDLNDKQEAGREDIHNRVLDAGNSDFWFNIPILAAGNFIQFGKMFNKSFANAARIAEQSGKRGVGNVARETTEEALRQNAKKAATEGLREGEVIARYTAEKATPWGKAWAIAKNPITEGNEEMAQQFVSSASGKYFSEEDPSEYWKAKLDPDSTRTATSFGANLLDAVQYGLEDSYLSGKQWEQGFIGALTGGIGMVMPTVNQKKGKDGKIHRRLGLNWSGGSWGDYKDYMADIQGGQELADNLNSRIGDDGFVNRFRNQVAHAYYQGQYDAAVNRGDKKQAKDEEDKQFAVDVESFVRAGKTEDLRTIYNHFAERDFSDEEIDGMIQSATQRITEEQDTERQRDAMLPDRKRLTTNYIRAREAYYRLRENLSKKRGRKTNAEYAKLKRAEDRLRRTASELLDINKKYDEVKGKASTANPYLDADGNPIDKDGNKISLEQLRNNIRQELKDNGRKAMENLDMYLAASDEVHELTKGTYSNEQEDWLTFQKYRSNKAKDRAKSILSENSEKIPKRVKVSKEKAKELQNTKTEGVTIEEEFDKKGNPIHYASFDTNLLSEDDMADLYESVLDDETGWDDFHDQLYKDVSTKLKKEKTNRSKHATDYYKLINDISDFLQLRSDSAGYDLLYRAGLANPESINASADKAEKNAEEEAIKEKHQGKTTNDMVNEVLDGKVSGDEVREASKSNDKDVSDIARKTAEILKAYTETNNEIDNSGASDAAKQVAKDIVERATRNADSVQDMRDTIINEDVDPSNMFPELGPDTLEELKKRASELISQVYNKLNASQNKRDDIPDKKPTGGEDNGETGNDSVSKVTTSNNPPGGTDTTMPSMEQLKDTEELVAQINEFFRNHEGNPAGGLRTCTTEFRYHNSDKPYHETLADKDSVEYKRSKAIYEYLKGAGAYERVNNPGRGRIEEGQTLHLMVRDFSKEIYGKNFNDLTDEEKERVLVILMVDEDNSVLGDLPLAQFEKSYNPGDKSKQTKSVTRLEQLQKQVLDAFKSKQLKTGCREAILDGDFKRDGAENLGLKAKDNKTPLTVSINEINMGWLPIQESGNRNTLNSVMGAPFSFAAMTIRDGVVANDNSVLNVIHRTNVYGQPYLVIPTANGAKWAMPVFFDPFSVDTYKDSGIYKILYDSIYNLVKDGEGKNEEKYVERLFDMLQLEPENHKKLIERDGNNYTFNLAHLTPLYIKMFNPDYKQVLVTVKVSGSTPEEVASKVLEQLGGISINVSIQNNNRAPNYAPEITGKLSYSEILGEKGTVHLPKNTPHSVNTWFSVSFDGEPAIDRNVKTTSGVHTHIVGNKEVNIDYDNYKAYDKNGNQIKGDMAVNVAIAQAKAARNNLSAPFTISLDGKQYTYDPSNKTLKEHRNQEAKEEGMKNVDTAAVVKRLQKDSWKLKLSDRSGKDDRNGDYYKNELDELRARVTSMIEGDKYVEPFDEVKGKNWILPSTTIGNWVDEYIRLFIEGKPYTNWNIKENLGLDQQLKISSVLSDMTKKLKEQGWEVVSRDLTVDGEIEVTDKDGNPAKVRVAGTLDLLLHNPKTGKFAIYDIKTYRVTRDKNGEIVDPLHPEDKLQDKRYAKWSAQLSVYKQLLEQKYPEMKGNISAMAIIPFQISGYDASNQEYSLNSNGELLDSEGKIVKLKLEYRGNTIPIKQREVKINMGKAKFKKEYNDNFDKIKVKEKQPESQPQTNPVLEEFKKDVENLSGYYEGGGAKLTDVVPDLPEELDDKLNNHFMGGEELTLEDYRELWKYIAFDKMAGDTWKMVQPRAKKVNSGNFDMSSIAFERKENKVEVTFTSKRGKSSTGEYTIVKDSDGYTHVTHSGNAQAKLHVSPTLLDDLGMTKDDILGPKDTWGLEDNYNEASKAIDDDLCYIESATLRPNGEVEIVTNQSFTIEGEAAKKIYELFFGGGEEKTDTGSVMSIEDIEKQVASALDVKTTNIWKKIPDDMKLKMFNKGVSLMIKAGTTSVSINASMKPSEISRQLSNLRGKIDVSESPKAKKKEGSVIKKEKEAVARKWLAKNLPALSSEERTRFVDKILGAGEDAADMWACFKNGVIQILNGAPVGTVYHEAFHYVFDFILDDNEKESVLKAAREAYQKKGENLTELELEERLAEDFRKYVLNDKDTSIWGKIKNWFRKLMESIRRWNKVDDSTINNLFRKINNGEFAHRSVTVEGFKANQQRILREVKDLRREKFLWDNLDNQTKDRIKDSGLTQEEFESMCTDEKEQWLKCK